MSFTHAFASLILVLQLTAACTHTATQSPASITDHDAITTLRDGNNRFTHNQTLHPRQDHVRLAEMSKGQAPEVVVVSCSDSRVPPEIVFDQGLGDIFSVRTAGHALDAYAVGSVEYAVEALGAKVILVLGHTSCGAIKAALTTPVGVSTGSPNIDQLVKSIRPGLKTADAADKELIQAAKNNVDASIAYLKQHSALISRALEQKKVKIVGGLYYLNTGEVAIW